MRAPRFALAALCASLLAATAAPAARAISLGLQTAPGRVLIDVAGGRAVIAAVAPLPDGGALLAGTVSRSGDVYVVRVAPSGLPDPSFGSGGVADVHAGLAFEQMLVQEDGRILLIGRRSPQGYRGPLPWQEEHLPLAVVRLLPDGSVDRTFGTGGTASAGIEGGCHCADVAVVGRGDALTLTGQRAERTPGERRPTYQWALARLSSSGARDSKFGVAGVATVPGKDGTGLSLESIPGSEELAAQGMQTVEEKDPNGGP